MDSCLRMVTDSTRVVVIRVATNCCPTPKSVDRRPQLLMKLVDLHFECVKVPPNHRRLVHSVANYWSKVAVLESVVDFVWLVQHFHCFQLARNQLSLVLVHSLPLKIAQNYCFHFEN